MTISTQTKANVANPPKGMRVFLVTKTGIKDSTGMYCNIGEMAVLNKAHAKAYLDRGMIRVELPDFGEGEFDDANDTDKAPAGASDGGKAASAASEDSGETADEPTANSAGKRTSRRV